VINDGQRPETLTRLAEIRGKNFLPSGAEVSQIQKILLSCQKTLFNWQLSLGVLGVLAVKSHRPKFRTNRTLIALAINVQII